MWVQGQVMNSPSDPTGPRMVSDALLVYGGAGDAVNDAVDMAHGAEDASRGCPRISVSSNRRYPSDSTLSRRDI